MGALLIAAAAVLAVLPDGADVTLKDDIGIGAFGEGEADVGTDVGLGHEDVEDVDAGVDSGEDDGADVLGGLALQVFAAETDGRYGKAGAAEGTIDHKGDLLK